jgi:hypothetical protein
MSNGDRKAFLKGKKRERNRRTKKQEKGECLSILKNTLGAVWTEGKYRI